MIARMPALSLALTLLGSCTHEDHRPNYGPHGEHAPLVPDFTAKQDSVSTSFTGRIGPQQRFLIGAQDGLFWTKPNARLTINAADVWAHNLLVISLYDGERDEVGSDETLIWRWELAAPHQGDRLEFIESIDLQGRDLRWIEIDFRDFAGIAILEVLGHD